MKRKEVLHFLLVVAILIPLLSIAINYVYLSPYIVSGRATAGGTVSLFSNGSAGITVVDDTIDFGRGYHDGRCTDDFSTLNSNISRLCWVNLSAYPTTEDVHILANSGTAVINVTVSVSNLTDAEELYCGSAQACNASNSGRVSISSVDNETGSCAAGTTSGFETLASTTSNFTIGLCDSLAYQDTTDTIKMYVELRVPRDAHPGNKTLILNYQAVAV